MKNLINDFIGLLGTTSVCYGCYLVKPWIAYIVAGMFLIVYALLNGLRVKKVSKN